MPSGTEQKLVVGLGNPGREYAGTRHNVGFETVESLAGRLGWTSRPDNFDRQARKKFEGLLLDGPVTVGGCRSVKLLLLEPATFMNLSGRSVQAAMAFYQLSASDVMVVLDDLALPAGRLRVRAGGSNGGHNGLRDIERALGTSQYPRLRIGIDPAPPPVAGRDYVLGRFTPAQRPLIDAAVRRAGDALLVWVEKGTQAAMNQFNAEETQGD